MSDLAGRPALDLVSMLRGGELSAAELTAAALAAIDAREDELRAWAFLDPDLALTRARELDRVPEAERGVLHGLPIGVKDIIDTADMPTEYGSPIYAGHRPAEDADIVAQLRAAGAVIIGKTVTTEFALFNPGPTTNPHDASRTPGGSSSGSAAAVGAGTVPLALGTQTAGSIVRPASFCGIYGVKPTFGTIPVRGVKPCAPSLDTPGVLARDVAGARLALGALGALRDADPPKLRFGFVRPAEWDLVPADTRRRIEHAIEAIRSEENVIEIEPPSAFAGLAEAQTQVMSVEVARSLSFERADHPDLLSPALRGVLSAGDEAAGEYTAARAHIARCRDLLPELFASADVLVAPSVLGEAPPLAEGTGDPLLCRAWTALGVPAVSVPGLTGPSGLPLGLQVIAPPSRDARALGGAERVGEVLA